MSKEVLVIGGGIVGLCCSYYLRQEGHQVRVIDKSNMDQGASYVNAGYLTPSHIIPLAAPGVMKKGLKWMFNSSSPLFIKPRLEADFIKWTLAFNRSCSQANVDRSVRAIRDINLLSRELFPELKSAEDFNFQLERKGLIMLCQTQKMLDAELEVADLAAKEGLEVAPVTREEIFAMEPDVKIDTIGGVHFGCDGHTTPNQLMAELKNRLPQLGVEIQTQEEVQRLETQGDRIVKVVTNKDTYTPDEVVLASGSWSAKLTKQLGIKMLLEAGKGYRINSTRDLGIKMPAILCESKVAVTPMDGFTRFAGTMEIAGINHKIRPERVEAIAKAATKYYPDVALTQAEKAEAACGLRPVSPDGMAYIGRSGKCSNLVLATGHAMMGWSMGPATGKLVSELISDKKTSMDLSPFNPDRKF
ncbi:amino acid dehydrogenase [Gilvibacter sp. SZ-19]|uniref:NAD(P)/FAD-dependent oxidoreductase n=1 Tax=Gilvibacter sp. SZ-19 TaxID=754429 RepID=UPI000B3C4AF4|nr:FAD-dependent oxidoreductase [Gilvibacter sp. SZ-19]ARV12260.1 amino acid dehydrogenase [Gilvibacter sp. SZ-19]